MKPMTKKEVIEKLLEQESILINPYTGEDDYLKEGLTFEYLDSLKYFTEEYEPPFFAECIIHVFEYNEFRNIYGEMQNFGFYVSYTQTP